MQQQGYGYQQQWPYNVQHAAYGHQQYAVSAGQPGYYPGNPQPPSTPYPGHLDEEKPKVNMPGQTVKMPGQSVAPPAPPQQGR